MSMSSGCVKWEDGRSKGKEAGKVDEKRSWAKLIDCLVEQVVQSAEQVAKVGR